MPSVTLHTSPSSTNRPRRSLPQLLQTPSGLAILEIQGSIHAPFPSDTDTLLLLPSQTDIGRLEFPLYDAAVDGEAEGKWMKKVYLYVGKHQKLVGEVRKLQNPMAVLKKRDGQAGTGNEDLEITEIIRWKLMFGGRPEPVSEDG
jgi:chromosome transmission fidelity protein 8